MLFYPSKDLGGYLPSPCGARVEKQIISFDTIQSPITCSVQFQRFVSQLADVAGVMMLLSRRIQPQPAEFCSSSPTL